MTDSQSPEERVRREIPEYRVTRPQKVSVTSFLPNNDHPTSTFVSQIGSTSRKINLNPYERPELEKKPYPSANVKAETSRSLNRQDESAQNCQSNESRNTKRKGSPEQSEQWKSNEISFSSMPGIYVDGGSSSEVMYEHCFQSLRAETKAA
ncbi:hypothetical protein Tco_0210022 [Tanacetum coccineum]